MFRLRPEFLSRSKAKLLTLSCNSSNYMSRIVRKPDFCLGENKGADQLRGTAKLISAFVFATRIVQFLFYLNPKFQASCSFLSLYRPVCVGPGRKPRRQVFSRRGSYLFKVADKEVLQENTPHPTKAWGKLKMFLFNNIIVFVYIDLLIGSIYLYINMKF